MFFHYFKFTIIFLKSKGLFFKSLIYSLVNLICDHKYLSIRSTDIFKAFKIPCTFAR